MLKILFRFGILGARSRFQLMFLGYITVTWFGADFMYAQISTLIFLLLAQTQTYHAFQQTINH